MKYIPREILVRTSFGPIRTIVTAEAIQALWGPDSGPNLGQNIVDVHRVKLERVAYEKFVAQAADKKGPVEIVAADVA
jgi:hypothetical protein